MKKILTFFFALFAALTVNAEVVNLGTMQLDKDYALEDFKGYQGTFTAPKSGVLNCYSTNTDDLSAYSDAAHTKACKVTKNGMYGPHSYDLTVEQGQTIYFYASFIMNSATFRLTMEDSRDVKLEGSSPALNAAYNLSNGGQMYFEFNKAVSFTGATITLGTQTQKLSGQVSNNSIFFNDVKDKVWNALKAGTVKPGDTFTVVLSGICLAADKTILYEGTGTLTANFKVGPMPIELVRTENTYGDFLSYYTTSDERGIVKLHFNGKVNPSKLSAQLKYGEVDQDPNGGYYVEFLTPTLSDDGQTIIVNLQGKRRKNVDMLTNGMEYETITLGITGVMDYNGNYAYADGDGSLGSYWYAYNFKEVTANIGCEFTPDNGSDISKKSTFEIWIMDEEKLTYDGILVTYEKDGVAKSLLITDYEKEADDDPLFPGAAYLYYSLPSEIKTAQNVSVCLQNLLCADGSDWSSTIRVRYNSFVISAAKPLAGSSREFFNAGESITVTTNKDAEIAQLKMVLRDTNPAEGDRDVLFRGMAKKTGRGFAYTLTSKCRLEKNHTYRLEATAINAAGQVIGSDYITYEGAADIFRYSDTQLTAISPDPAAAYLPENGDATITLTYDGMVKIAESTLFTASAIAPDADGFANTWTLTVPKETLAAAGTSIMIPVYAIDSSEAGYPVQGNSGYKDSDFLALFYAIGEGNLDAVDAITAQNNHNKYIINLAGQRSDGARGIVIINGRKILK